MSQTSKTSGMRKKRRGEPTLVERMGTWMLEHPGVAGVLCTVFVAGTFALISWFTLFSGLGASADFVYSKF